MKKSALNEKITAKKFVWLKWFMHGLEGRGGGMEGGDEGRSLASRANNLAKGFNSQKGPTKVISQFNLNKTFQNL